MTYYYLIPCENCGLIDSTYKMKGYKHQTCPIKFFSIDRQNIELCFEQILLSPIPSSPKTLQRCNEFYFFVDYINEYPDINSTTTLRIIDALNAMMHES